MAVRTQVAALRPAHGRQERDAMLRQVGALVPRREFNVGPGPLGRPGVFVVEAVKGGAPGPVTPGQFKRVFDTHPTLLGTVDEEDATKTTRKPERPSSRRSPDLRRRLSCRGGSTRGSRPAQPVPLRSQ